MESEWNLSSSPGRNRYSLDGEDWYTAMVDELAIQSKATGFGVYLCRGAGTSIDAKNTVRLCNVM